MMDKPKVIPFTKKDSDEEADFLTFKTDEKPDVAHARLAEELGWDMPPLGDLDIVQISGRTAFRRKG